MLLIRIVISPLYLQTAERFRAEWPTNAYAKGFVSYVDRLKKPPSVSLRRDFFARSQWQTGNTFFLSGKYVQFDFLGQMVWPVPSGKSQCREGLEKSSKAIDLISWECPLDRVREDWVNAIQEDGLGWTQVSDLKYFQSQPVSDYNIEGIPFSVLVDPNGIIGQELARVPN